MRTYNRIIITISTVILICSCTKQPSKVNQLNLTKQETLKISQKTCQCIKGQTLNKKNVHKKISRCLDESIKKIISKKRYGYLKGMKMSTREEKKMAKKIGGTIQKKCGAYIKKTLKK